MPKTWSIVDGKGTAHVIEDVRGCDVFDDSKDRPDCFLTGDGAKHAPRKPTCDGVLHPFDTRVFND